MRPALLCLLLIACANDPIIPEPLTRGEACVQVAAAICAHSMDCGTLVDVQQCRAATIAGCCSALCAELVPGLDQEQVDICVGAIETSSCPADSLPASCPTFNE